MPESLFFLHVLDVAAASLERCRAIYAQLSSDASVLGTDSCCGAIYALNSRPMNLVLIAPGVGTKGQKETQIPDVAAGTRDKLRKIVLHQSRYRIHSCLALNLSILCSLKFCFSCSSVRGVRVDHSPACSLDLDKNISHV